MSRRALFGASALGVVALGALGATQLPPAFADGYPSWDDVQRAKSNEAAKQAEITRINALIQQLNQNVSTTQAQVDSASQAFFTAQQSYFDAAKQADDLQQQADQQAAKAVAATNKAGQLAAQLYRNGGDDTALKLLFAGSAAGTDQLLSQLGTMEKLLQRNNTVYADALTAHNNAQSLSDQAKTKREIRDQLQQQANQAMQTAQAAAAIAQQALQAQNQNADTLNAQLAALKDNTARTITDYQAGVVAAQKAKEEAERKAREQAAAAAAAASNSGGGGGGVVVSGNWARPAGGYLSSPYGPRSSQCSDEYCASTFHYGDDLANGTCGFPIYAATNGTVVYAGRNGGYGNYIKLDHGGGVGSGYAHIVDGGILVGYGDRVNVGQLIAYSGNTGASFGCHLHFEIYINGSPVNPAPFMAQRGIYF